MTSETTRPSEHYTQHHDVEPPRVDARAFRQGWRVRTRLDALLADQRITAATWQAACEYRTAWETIMPAACSTLASNRTNATRDYHRSALARVIASTRIRQCDNAIGDAAILTHACLLEDRSWASIARQLGVNPETARDWTATALTALAGAWNQPIAEQHPHTRDQSLFARHGKARQRLAGGPEGGGASLAKKNAPRGAYEA